MNSLTAAWAMRSKRPATVLIIQLPRRSSESQPYTAGTSGHFSIDRNTISSIGALVCSKSNPSADRHWLARRPHGPLLDAARLRHLARRRAHHKGRAHLRHRRSKNEKIAPVARADQAGDPRVRAHPARRGERVSAKQFKYCFEDFRVGMVIEQPGPTLTRDDILEFARRYDPQPMHLDEEAAKRSIYGGLIASGWQTASLTTRMMCDSYLLDSSSLGSPGMKEVSWPRPVRPGDTLRLRMTVLETKPSTSKPDRGSVLHRWEVFNQAGEPVLRMEGIGMFKRRNPA